MKLYPFTDSSTTGILINPKPNTTKSWAFSSSVMERMRGRRGIGERASTQQVVYEDFQPIADWTNDSNSHVLLVDLPGFKKEEVKLQVVNNGIVKVSGERQLSENRYKRFKQEYSLPMDSDIGKISGKFDGGLLFVIIPKKEYEIEEEPKQQHHTADRTAEEHKQETSKTEEKPKKGEPEQETTTIEEKPKKDGKGTDDKHDHRNGIPDSKKNEDKGGLNENREEEEEGFNLGFAASATEMITRNKGMVVAVILGFTVGMYLSYKLRSTDP